MKKRLLAWGTMLLVVLVYAVVTSATAAEVVVPPAKSSIAISAVGDICFTRASGASLGNSKKLLAHVAPTLKAADITIGNLETPLSNRGAPVKNKAFTFRSSPKSTAGLTSAGFDIVSLANNHTLDYGRVALRDTVSTLRNADIGFAGAGTNKTEARRPYIFETKGARVAYLAFSEITPANYAATSDRSGTAYTQDISAITKAVKKAKKQADYVVVSMHWGVEKEYSPTGRQVSEGRAIIRSGADVVLGHHPHRIQGIEYYKNGLIAYSLGNFVFPAASSGSSDSLILNVVMGPQGIESATVNPVTIVSGTPKLAKGAAATRLFKVIKKTSRSRGTHVSLVGNVATLKP